MSVIRRTTPPAQRKQVIPGPGRFIPASDLQPLRRSPLHALLQATARYGDLLLSIEGSSILGSWFS